MHRMSLSGGAGFLGCQLYRKLVHCGHKVVCLNNQLTGQQLSIEVRGDPLGFSCCHDVVPWTEVVCGPQCMRARGARLHRPERQRSLPQPHSNGREEICHESL